MRRTEGMIDLTLDYHAHVLPGCDHGSDGVETSRKQLAMAAAAGIRTVCATPHFYPHKESIPSFLQRRAESAQLLRERSRSGRRCTGFWSGGISGSFWRMPTGIRRRISSD